RIVGRRVLLEVRLTLDHLRRRVPAWPRLLPLDYAFTGPLEALAAETDAVADRAAERQHDVEEVVAGIDNDRAGTLAGRIGDDLAMIARVDLLVRNRRNVVAAIGHRRIHQCGRRELRHWRRGERGTRCRTRFARSGFRTACE